MTQNDRYARAAASKIKRIWRGAHARAGAVPRSSITAAERALRARRRRRVMLTWAAPLVAASMVAGGGVWAWVWFAHRSHHAPTIASDSRSLMLFDAPAPGASSSGRSRSSRPLAAGDQVFAPHSGSLTLGDAAGTELTVEPGGNLTVLDAGAHRRFALHRGAVRARVHKLVAGQRFIIETSDSEIEVHGTAFRVELGTPTAVPCSGPGPSESIATRVSVSEGVVSVKWSGEEQRLRPGDQWPPTCPSASVTAPRPPPPGSAPAPVPAPGPKPATTAEAHGTRHQRGAAAHAIARAGGVASTSALEAQNDLFQAAVRARRHGRATEALGLFERYMDQYPEGSLYESALAQKMRLLAAGTDARGGVAVARQYLARFPDGFARDEARTLLGATTRP